MTRNQFFAFLFGASGAAAAKPPVVYERPRQMGSYFIKPVFYGVPVDCENASCESQDSKAAGTKTTILFHASEDGLSWLQAAPMQIKVYLFSVVDQETNVERLMCPQCAAEFRRSPHRLLKATP